MEFYKKIIKKRGTRSKILRKLSFIPDSLMLRIQYFIKMGHLLHLENPKRFTEKLQWYKIYYKDPLMIQCVDKADVRDYIKSKGLEDILVPCYGIYENAEEIDWNSLPDRFVMKDTLGGGGTKVSIVNDKENSLNELKRRARYWTRTSVETNHGGREWPYYSGKKHRVIFEKLLETDTGSGIVDYKFFCFNGKAEFIYATGNRSLGNSVCINIYDRDFNKLPVISKEYKKLSEIAKPANFTEMLNVAEKLSADFPHARVDLYSVNNKTFFGEITFYNGSGYMKYEPDSFDIIIGKKWQLPEKKEHF